MKKILIETDSSVNLHVFCTARHKPCVCPSFLVLLFLLLFGHPDKIVGISAISYSFSPFFYSLPFPTMRLSHLYPLSLATVALAQVHAASEAPQAGGGAKSAVIENQRLYISDGCQLASVA
jgi:hypothetical protein